MAYCTEDDLSKMIPPAELAELTAEAGEAPDSRVVAEAIVQATAEIDSYLGVRYLLPLDPVPELVKVLAVDLALFHLYARRSLAPPVRRQKYEAALAFLKEVAAGQAVLDGGVAAPQEAGRDLEELTSAPRRFTRNHLNEW